MASYAIVFAVAALATWVSTFAVKRIVVRVGLVVEPDPHRIHKKPLPTTGGAAMFAGFLVAMAVATQLGAFNDIFNSSSEPWGVVIAATVIFVVGAVDDLREVSPPAKLAGTTLAASVLYFLGVTMYYFRIPFADFVSVTPDWAPLLTVVWLAGMTTAVNYIDGLDGLAAGIVAIGAGSLFVYANRLGDVGLLGPDNMGALLAVITCGVCIGFLPHNFNPAKIIMGDAGALFLGLCMAAATTVVGGRTADQFSGQTFFFFAPLFIPFFILGIPMIDTAFVTLKRAARREGISTGVRHDHLHYRLERMGHGHRRAVVILWAWSAVLSGFVLFPTLTGDGNAVVPVAVVALGIILYTGFHPGIRQKSPIITEDPDIKANDPALAPVVPIDDRRELGD